MMKMLRNLGLMVFAVCIAAFASGCGGGGGGGGSAMMEEEPPPVMEMECTSPQVGTYPDCMDPGPTDAERITDAQDTLADIVTDASTRVLAARTAANAVYAHLDATDAQIDLAINYLLAAQDALTDITAASTAVNAATTPEAAEMALAEARAALADLFAAQTGVENIQIALQTPATPPPGPTVTDVGVLTNNSSLIQHVRANKILSDALLGSLTSGTANNDGSIRVGPADVETTVNMDGTESCDAPCATFPGNTGTGADRVTGQRTVRVGTLISNINTPTLSGPSRFPNGFDLKNDDDTTYINAYTDISQTRLKVRTRTNIVEDNPSTMDMDERYAELDFEDTDYLVAGIWLTVDNADLSNSRIQAFAYGSQPIVASSTFCSGIEASAPTSSTSGTTTTDRNCEPTAGLSTIAGTDSFVEEGKTVTATYNGNANGAYIAGGDTSYFTASVTLTAEFLNPITQGDMVADDGEGSIQGSVTNITAGGQSMAGSIELQKQDLNNDISAAFTTGTTVGVVDGKSFSGGWKGQFFGLRHKPKTTETETDRTDPMDVMTTITTTYKPDAPGSVAGTFFATQQSNPAGEAAFIGAFGANR